MIDELLRKKCTAYTYEFLETSDGLFPMAYPGGEIAGKMAVMYANYFMQGFLIEVISLTVKRK